MQFELPKERPSIIKVIGVGGGGSNAVNHMYRLGIKGVEFLVCNTDHQALDISPVPYKIQLGPSLTEGRGAGAIPEVGKNAAIENIDELKAILRENTKMVVITAGMGGGTGTGAAPIIAGVAREMGILTVGIVTVPFAFEGKKRKAQADAGIEELKQNVDTLLVICNEKLREIHGNLKLTEAFGHADNILAIAAKSIAEIITTTMHINVDFADIQTVMKSSGVAIMGSASAEGENRAISAVKSALDSPLLNDNEIEGARYILLNITSGEIEVTMDEMGEITDFVQEQAGMTAEVIMGVGKDDTLGNRIGVTIIATGFKTKDHNTSVAPKPEAKIVYNLADELKSASPVPIKPIEVTPVNIVPSPLAEVVLPVAQVEQPVLKPVVISASTPTLQPSNQQLNQNVVEERIVHHLISDEEISAMAKLNENIVPMENMEQVNAQEPTLITRQPEVPAEPEATFVFEVNTPVIAEKAPEPVTIPKLPIIEHTIFQGPPPVKQNEIAVDHDDPFHRAQDRIRKLREMSMKVNSPGGLVDLEKEPAYKRRNVQLNDVPDSSDIEVSRYTLSADKDNKPEIKSNNSFLHDRVD
ncbi:MAG: cell division protein FtsZ [Bacteroidetes bacterium]|nr:cell division protein FtsZ [Bacteroidota bacterium]